jgi:hypothetical protein
MLLAAQCHWSSPKPLQVSSGVVWCPDLWCFYLATNNKNNCILYLKLRYTTVFQQNFLKDILFESFSISRHITCFGWYGHHQVFKTVVDGNCCASIFLVPVFWYVVQSILPVMLSWQTHATQQEEWPSTTGYTSTYTGPHTKRLELQKSKHSSSHQTTILNNWWWLHRLKHVVCDVMWCGETFWGNNF